MDTRWIEDGLMAVVFLVVVVVTAVYGGAWCSGLGALLQRVMA